MLEAGLPARPPAPQVRRRDRRRAEEVPPARRPVGLRRAGAHGAGLVAAVSAGRRPRQLRLRRRRPGCRIPLHGGAAGADGDGAAARHRLGDGRLRAELRRVRAAAGRAAVAVPEPAGQRRGRHRRRHGHEHPAAQPRRGHRRRRPLPRQPRGHAQRAHEVHQGAGLPDGGHHHGPPGHPGRLRDRPRLDQACARVAQVEEGTQRQEQDRRHRAAVSGEQGAARREDRRARQDAEDQGHRRPQGRVEPRGHAPGHRDEARREPAASC